MKKRFEYWSKEGKVWTDWFDWDTDFKPELQMEDRRIFCRLKNEYKEEELLNNIKKFNNESCVCSSS